MKKLAIKILHHSHEWLAMIVPLAAERQLVLILGATVVFALIVILILEES